MVSCSCVDLLEMCQYIPWGLYIWCAPSEGICSNDVAFRVVDAMLRDTGTEAIDAGFKRKVRCAAALMGFMVKWYRCYDCGCTIQISLERGAMDRW